MPIYMKIDKLQGESTAEGHTDQIEVASWSWGESNSSRAFGPGGGGASAGKVVFNDLSFQMFTNKASPELFLACANGKHFASAELFVTKTSNDKVKDYLIVKMTTVVVTSYQISGAGGSNDRPMESISLNFAKVEVDYKSDTAGKMASYKAGWDLAKSVKV